MLPNVTWVKAKASKDIFRQFWSMILCFWKVKCQFQTYTKTVNNGKKVNTGKTVNIGKPVNIVLPINTVTVIGIYCFYWDTNNMQTIIPLLLL